MKKICRELLSFCQIALLALVAVTLLGLITVQDSVKNLIRLKEGKN